MNALDLIEQHIRTGKSQDALILLRKIKLSRLARPELARIANLARRVGRPQISVRALNKLVRPRTTQQRPATAVERAEYGIALSRIGAYQEGLRLLQSVSPSEHLEVLLYRSICHFTDWNYNLAIPLLAEYVEEHPEPYQKLVGRVNLAAAYVYENRLDVAEETLALILDETKKKNLNLLFGNANELMAQVHFQRKKFRQGTLHLEEASRNLQRGESFDFLFIKKWNAFIEAAEKKNLEPLLELKKEAWQRSHWETVRDCDFQIAGLKPVPELYVKLYFGSLAAGFKERVRREISEDQMPDRYIWHPGNKESGRNFDLETASDGVASLKRGYVLHRCLQALTMDFYRPFRSATLFGLLFSNEYYNPVQSPLRVQQTVFRLRDWLDKNKIPLQIEEFHGSYRITTQSGYGLIKTTGVEASDPLREQLKSFQERSGKDSFFLKEFQQQLQISKRQSIRIVQAACDAGLVQRSDLSRPRYRILNPLK